MQADWVLMGGRVRSFDRHLGAATALAVRDGAVCALGTDDQVAGLIGPGTRRTDLSGATVLPGFCDTHMHLEKVSHEFTMVQLQDAVDIAGVLQRVSERAADAPADMWIRCLADNEGWHERNLAEGRLPTRAELDAVTPEHAAYLYRRPDRAVLNTIGMRRLTDILGTLTPEEYDPESGWLRGTAVRRVNDAIYVQSAGDLEFRLDILGRACQRLLSMGLTTIVDPGLAGSFSPAWDLYGEARSRGLLPQRVRLMNRLDWRRPFAEQFEALASVEVPPGSGDDRLQAWAVKLLLDGEFENAWMRAGEENRKPSEPHYSPEQLLAVMTLCAERGWPLCVHTMGGGAIDAVLEAVATLRARDLYFRPGDLSLAHAFLIDANQIARCGRFGIRISANPTLAAVYTNEMRAAWGPVAGRNSPLATMELLGFAAAGGSDTHPCAPLAGAGIAVTRRAWDGTSIGAAEAISPLSALAMYLPHAGDYINAPHVGRLGMGAAADLTIWERDPLDVPPEEWGALTPLEVAIAGRTVFSDEAKGRSL